MDGLELREDWRVEQKNSLEVNFYLSPLTQGCNDGCFVLKDM